MFSPCTITSNVRFDMPRLRDKNLGTIALCSSINSLISGMMFNDFTA